MATELYPQDNAASINTEVNGVGVWVNNSEVKAEFTSDGTAPDNGLYNLKIVSLENWANVSFSLLNCTIGHTYRWSWRSKATQPNEQSTSSWSGVTTSPNISMLETVWTSKTVDVEATDTTILTYFAAGSGGGVAGDTLEIDTFSIIDLDEPLPTTTTVEIEWIDSISAAATGNKIYRDDIEIDDIANGVQIYQDTTAETGTEYKYEVQAHDGAGDETTQEVEGENMDYITTAS